MLFVSRLNIKIKPLSFFRLTARLTAESAEGQSKEHVATHSCSRLQMAGYEHSNFSSSQRVARKGEAVMLIQPRVTKNIIIMTQK